MKRSYVGVIALSIVLLFNIICTQQVVNSFYFEKYEQTLLFAVLNLILFPIAWSIYRKEKNADDKR